MLLGRTIPSGAQRDLPAVSLTELGHIPALGWDAAKEVGGAVCPQAFGNLFRETEFC